MTSANVFNVADHEIRALLYLPSDRTIAAHLGVAVDRVAKIRAAQPKDYAIERRDVREGEPIIGLGAEERKQATQGSDALLRRLLAYGLKRDGLPGLSAAQFFARCREADVVVLR